MTPALLTAIAVLLEGVSRKDLALRADRLSPLIARVEPRSIVADQADALGLSGNAAACHLCRHACGSGPGDGGIAGFHACEPDGCGRGARYCRLGGAGSVAIAWCHLVEPNAIFRTLAAKLMPDAEIIAGGLGATIPHADLVVANYVLAELPEMEAVNAAGKLWEVTERMLVLVEPGTPAGICPHSRGARGADRSGRACRGAVHARQELSSERWRLVSFLAAPGAFARSQNCQERGRAV